MTLRPVLPLLALAAFSLAACSRSDDEPAPEPSAIITQQAVPTVAADGTPFTPGRWDVGEDASGATATFTSDAGALLVMRCERATRVLSLTRPGAATAAQTVRIDTSALKADVSMTPRTEAPAGLYAAIDPLQPIFTAWSDPAAKIVLTAPGAATLTVPGHPGISRVVTACS